MQEKKDILISYVTEEFGDEQNYIHLIKRVLWKEVL